MSVDDDSEWEDELYALPQDSDEISNGQPSKVEQDLIQELANAEIDYVGVDEFDLTFLPRPSVAEVPGRKTTVPRDYASALLAQIRDRIEPYPHYSGFIAPAIGYAELAFRSVPRRMAGAPLQFSFRRAVADVKSCRHSANDISLPAVPISRFSARFPESVIHHLASERVCIEISGASPYALALGLGGRFGQSILTLKFAFNVTLTNDEMISEVQALLSSLMYELDVRNGVSLYPLRRRSPEVSRTLGPRSPGENPLRFPEMAIKPEVSALFSFAGIVGENPTLSYLFYYQVLEYFFPSAVGRASRKRIQDELSDPLFNKADDRSLMRILAVAEKSANQSEDKQLKTLLQECVRSDKLADFFSGSNWDKHFTGKGPIGGVENINPGNNTKSLSDQVADRIYQLRNRIVHAKDDIRYEQARPLLPQSGEADALWPDVSLVRLLASEAILYNHD
ncbi:hypothetical protein [Catenulispora rubra]|uniref:hypothetical protein n=1 Tax=Catenulispora rubra TaxID=280293 RepID=UPI0018920CE9|nr:hypothetical protein [Catenulispora rubra]